MKLSDFVAAFLAEYGVKHAFVLTGGASLHLIHGIHKTEGIDYVCCHHEQSAAMAADAYSRVTGDLGVAVVTSGPGATNLITGICGAFYDSVPALFITGQVATFRLSGDSGVRQTGFQETPIVDMCSVITKYAVQITRPEDIKRELQKAIFLAKSGRPGPVLIDIPDDVQRMDVGVDSLESFYPPEVESADVKDPSYDALAIIDQLRKSVRPVIIAGWGLHLAGCEEQFLGLVEKLGVPVVLTWGASDILPDSHPLRVGTFGTHGTRYANFAVQNADFILSLGSRLDTKATGSPPSSFAREAWKAVVDIDQNELNKFERIGLSVDCLVHSDVSQFIETLDLQVSGCPLPQVANWHRQIADWKNRYRFSVESYDSGRYVAPYSFVNRLSECIPEKANILVDTGSAIAWVMQCFEAKKHHRIWHDYNNTAMGWALPASIAAAVAEPDVVTYCVVGDGSLMMNLQELATVTNLNLNIKIICLDNSGYSMIQQTQDQWMDSQYVASSKEGGVGFPNLLNVAREFGFEVGDISVNEDVEEGLFNTLNSDQPFFCRVKIDRICRVVPQVKFGRPNEDSEPLLKRSEFMKQMIIPPLPVSEED